MAWALAGCSAVQFTYNQGSTLAYWWLDRYVDFQPEQSRRAKAALGEWFAWHRTSQLQEYAAELRRLQKLASDDTTADQACSTWAAWQKRLERATAQALPAAADIARSLSAEQVTHLEQHQADQLAEARRDLLQPTPAERRQAAFERTRKRAEWLYGPLEEPQRQVLRDGLARSPYDAERSLADRQRRQQRLVQELRAWLAAGADAATVAAGLRRQLADNLQPTRPEDEAYRRRLTEANCALVAQLHNASSPAQRQRAAEQLGTWADDFAALAANRR